LKLCPYCNQELIETENGLICPIHGKIFEEEESTIKIPSYVK